jgi:sugar lactone lactonase YvrE
MRIYKTEAKMNQKCYRVLAKLLPVVFSSMLLTIGFCFTPVCAQNLLNNPESVVYDSLADRYLVSNFGDGSIVQIISDGSQSYFNTTLTRIAGLHLKDNILYVAANLEPYVGVYGFDLTSGEMVFSVDISSDGLLNDVATDTSGFLYVTDYYDHKIFKIDLENRTWSLFVDTVLDWPNGIIFDKHNNRLLVASVDAPGRPLHAVDLADSTVSVAVYTYIYSIDGLAYDNEDRLYLSSWWTDAVYRYDAELSDSPEMFSNGHPDPADICVDKVNNILCIPIFYENRVDFVEIYQTSTDNISLPDKHFTIANYPNPFNASTVIQYNLPSSSDVTIEIYDILGRKIETLVQGEQPAGNHQVTWDAGYQSSGIYFYRIQAGEYTETRKMVILK